MKKYWYWFVIVITVTLVGLRYLFFFNHQEFYFVSLLLIIFIVATCFALHIIHRNISSKRHEESKNGIEEMKEYVNTSIKESEARMIKTINDKLTKLPTYLHFLDGANGDLASENDKLNKLIEHYKEKAKKGTHSK